MHTTDPTQTSPPPSPDPAPYAPDPALVLPNSIYYQVVHTLGGLLPPPVTDTPEAPPTATMTSPASPLPTRSPWTACASHDCRVAPMLFLKCTAQAPCMMREARGARTLLMRIQAERRKRELDNATRDRAAWTEHCAIGLTT